MTLIEWLWLWLGAGLLIEICFHVACLVSSDIAEGLGDDGGIWTFLVRVLWGPLSLLACPRVIGIGFISILGYLASAVWWFLTKIWSAKDAVVAAWFWLTIPEVRRRQIELKRNRKVKKRVRHLRRQWDNVTGAYHYRMAKERVKARTEADLLHEETAALETEARKLDLNIANAYPEPGEFLKDSKTTVPVK